MPAKNTTIFARMNAMGKAGKPFVFVINSPGDDGFAGSYEEAASAGIFFSIGDISNHSPTPSDDKPFIFNKYPLPFEVYDAAFRQVVRQIRYGNSYLLNLTFPTRVETTLSLEEIYHRSQARYRLLFCGQFVAFSPETFVTIRGNTIRSHPMKGTIDASVPDAEKVILADPKETAEHCTIVDLIRNDLSIIAKDVVVENFRYIDRISTNLHDLLQVSSVVSGRLPDNYAETLGDLFRAILPAGSVTGAPKKKTVDIIRTVESSERGFYTGIFGIFDGENTDSGVIIRYIEKQEGGLFFRSGGGITSLSDARAEYREMIDKVYVPIV